MPRFALACSFSLPLLLISPPAAPPSPPTAPPLSPSLPVVSFVVFPVRARGLLERKMASTMVQIGDLAVWLVGQACTPPAPGTPGRLPGASGTDGKQ